MRYTLLITLFAVAALTVLWLALHEVAPTPVQSTTDARATWYIDAESGNDEQDGRTEATAWKSLSRLQKSHQPPGSRILLRRGGIWRESLTLDTSGTAESPILIGSYGTGAPPSLRGSDAFDTPGRWQYEAEGIWYLEDIRQDPGVFFYDGHVAVARANKDDLADPWNFWYDAPNRRLYVRLDSNPAAVAASIEVPVRDYVVGPLDQHYIHLEGIELRHAIKTSLLLWEADNVLVSECAFTQTGGTHCQIGQGSSYARIARCTFDDWNLRRDRGYAIQSVEAGSGPTDVERCHFRATLPGGGEDHTAILSDDKAWIRTVRACQFLGNNGNLAGDGVRIWRPGSPASALAIEENFFQALGGRAIALEELDNYGGAMAVTVQRNRIQNVCLRDEAGHDAVQVRGLANGRATVLLARNILRGTMRGSHPHAGIGIRETGGVQILHNGIQGADDGILIGFGGLKTLVANNLLVNNRGVGLRDEGTDSEPHHNAYFQNTGGPITGQTLTEKDIQSDPRVNDELRLLPGSPCIDAGVQTVSVTDLEGRSVPIGSAPDIGPCEYAPTPP